MQQMSYLLLDLKARIFPVPEDLSLNALGGASSSQHGAAQSGQHPFACSVPGVIVHAALSPFRLQVLEGRTGLVISSFPVPGY